jgi:hypothetical protein
MSGSVSAAIAKETETLRTRPRIRAGRRASEGVEELGRIVMVYFAKVGRLIV